MYEKLTKYLDTIASDAIGNWIIDRENDGTIEHPIQMPYVSYSELAQHFIDDVYHFIKNHNEMGLNQYVDILNEYGIEWGTKSMTDVDADALDARCIMALIVGAVRLERFCDGALLGFFKSGTISKWLKRLRELERDGD